MTRLTVERLTPEAFAPFGTVIAPDPAKARMINGGTTTRFHELARAEASGEGAAVIINIFRGEARRFPYTVDMMERHPLGSQSFSPLDRMNVKDSRWFRHGFSPGSMNGRIYPNAGRTHSRSGRPSKASGTGRK